MIRKLLATVSRLGWVRKAAMSTPLLRGLAWRFVAGESQEEGLEAARRLNARGLRATLNFIGTHVRRQPEAIAAADTAVRCLERIHAAGLEAHLSMKLTQIGLDLDPGLCRRELERVLETAHALGNFIRVDMEESPYTGETLAIFQEALARHPDTVGIVLQSYLRRTRADLERMVALGARIRLVKGGYWESGEVAFRRKAEVDQALLGDLEYLLRNGRRPAIATHDPAAVDRALQVAEQLGLAKDDLEFQMLYGVREDLAESLVRRGYRVRSYVPYGSHWYEYVLGCVRKDPGQVLQVRKAS